MAVYYKFKSARDYDSIPMDGPFISVGVLKDKILESKHLGKGTDFDLVVTNAQTNEEYLEEAMLIPKNTSVLIRRVPGRPRMPIVTEDEPKMENKEEDVQPEKSSLIGADSSTMKYPPEDSEWDEFGNDLYAIPEVLPVQSSVVVPDVVPTNKADEESKIKALINTPALDWQRQGNDGFGPGRGFGRGMAGRMGGRGFGMERKTPPQGYVCHRCNVPGHFIQHCPTNGDPNYDIKRVKPPTGIPKSMLMASSDGSYALPSGAVAILKPNEAAFEKEIEGLPSTRSIGDLPPELHCPLCKEVMKDAVLTSKCCFNSFCDKCIRDHIISKSMCVCGATNILADDLLPNKTLRDTINRIMESGNSSAENVGSAYQVQDMESARGSQPKVPSPSVSAASKGEQKPSPPPVVETQNSKESMGEMKVVAPPPPVQSLEKARTVKIPDVSEATHESVSVRETASQGSAPLIEEEVQQRPVSGEAVKKKKKKKVRVPTNAADMPWRGPQDLAAENYMMPLGPSAFNPYWSGMQPGMEGFMAPYGGGMPPYMGYGMGPLDMPFGGVLPPDPFGAQPYMMPPVPPPQRDLAFGMGLNPAPPIMSREEFEARKADLRRKRENERRVESKPIPRDRDPSRDLGRDMSSAGDVSSVRSKSKSAIPAPSAEPSLQRHRSERPSPDRSTGETHRYRSERSSVERSSVPIEAPPRPSKRKSDHHRDSRDYVEDHPDHDRPKRSETSKRTSSEPSKHPTSSSSAAAAAAAAAAEKKHKASVFSRISFPEEEPAKKRKVSSSSVEPSGASSTHHYHKGSSANNGYYDDHKSSSSLKAVSTRRSSGHSMDYESSDDDRHFKRKPSRYEPSPPPRTEWEDEEEGDQAGRHSRRRDDRDRHSKHG